MYNFLKVTVCLFVLILNVITVAEAAEESLWSYASPAADVILYFNTRQPEEAMDKNLWQQIQADKNKAIDSDPDGQLFDTKNRDMETIANVFIRSMMPFSATVEGVANITGNIQNDIQKLLGSLSKDGLPGPQINKTDDLSKYNFSIPSGEGIPPIDIMFVPVNNNQLQFRINLAPQQAMPQETVAAAQGSAAFLGSVPGEAQAFVLAAQLDKLAAVPLPQDPRWQLALVCFKQIKNLCFSGQVQNLHLLIHGDIVCKDAASAGGIAQILLNCRDKFANKIKSSELPQITVKNNVVQLDAKVNIADGWKFIRRITPRTAAPAPAVGK